MLVEYIPLLWCMCFKGLSGIVRIFSSYNHVCLRAHLITSIDPSFQSTTLDEPDDLALQCRNFESESASHLFELDRFVGLKIELQHPISDTVDDSVDMLR